VKLLVSLVVTFNRVDLDHLVILATLDPAPLLVSLQVIFHQVVPDRLVRLNLAVVLVVLTITSHKAVPDHMVQPDIQDPIYHQVRKERDHHHQVPDLAERLVAQVVLSRLADLDHLVILATLHLAVHLVSLEVISHQVDLDRLAGRNLAVSLVIWAINSHQTDPDHMGHLNIKDPIYHQVRKERD